MGKPWLDMGRFESVAGDFGKRGATYWHVEYDTKTGICFTYALFCGRGGYVTHEHTYMSAREADAIGKDGTP